MLLDPPKSLHTNSHVPQFSLHSLLFPALFVDSLPFSLQSSEFLERSSPLYLALQSLLLKAMLGLFLLGCRAVP
jgi:hypothetical protein